MADKLNVEKMREDRRRAQRAAEDALHAAQEAGVSREHLDRTLAESDRVAEQYRRVMRQARLIR